MNQGSETSNLRVPRRRVTHAVRDLGGITWQPYYITLECGHRMGATSRQAHAKAIECWKCYHEAVEAAKGKAS